MDFNTTWSSVDLLSGAVRYFDTFNECYFGYAHYITTVCSPVMGL